MKRERVNIPWRIPRWGKPAAVAVLLLVSAYLAVFNEVEVNEVGLGWNRFTGELILQPPGFHLSAPWVAVSSIDVRPVRVCITSAGRGFSCKLVEFVPQFYREFVAVEGHRYYWWANRVSFNYGYDSEYRGMKDILRGHAYGATKYPFIKILREYQNPLER